MTWAHRLKRVFCIDFETYGKCGGMVKAIAWIEDPVVIEKILAHFQGNDAWFSTSLRPDSRVLRADLFG